MKAVIARRPGAVLELVEREIPVPGAGEVLLKVEACGICRGDLATKDGRHGIDLPRVPGHEVVGTIESIGAQSTRFALGQRVGVGWRAGACGRCEACRAGNAAACRNALTTGQHVDGGYAEYMIAREEALVQIPAGMAPAAAAPLLCAGRTTFAAFKNAGAKKGDLVVVQGIGGLGHLGSQIAAKLGCRTVAISHGKSKEEFARSLGADVYIDAAAQDPVALLREMGGVQAMLCTAPNSQENSALIEAMRSGWRFMVVGHADDPLQVPVRALIRGVQVTGAGVATMADALDFARNNGVQPMIETFSLEDANTAFNKMMDGTVHFRSVLAMG